MEKMATRLEQSQSVEGAIALFVVARPQGEFPPEIINAVLLLCALTPPTVASALHRNFPHPSTLDLIHRAVFADRK